MRKIAMLFLVCLLIVQYSCTTAKQQVEQTDMAWWSQARFGLFIHWGLYAVPAGEWNGETNHAEWIRHTAQIPIDTYDKFVGQFNPVKFNADEWVKMAKAAGMKYIVITSKHHDGFCLFDSEYTDYDIMSTPFQRDIMEELAAACAKEGLKMCWYHSIMDWHHPDYLPRRPWEKNRSTANADYDRYVQYMKNQLAELTSKYGDIGVLWFDGEWEDTWTHEHGVDLYHYVKSLQSNIIINNRVDKGRAGMEGMTRGDEFKGDFGTPEQEIPATGLPGVAWETCMTMNNHWGYNKNDDNWKSDKDLLQKLADIASKGGNFLLNVGPKADGTWPQESIDRLAAMGKWMDVNGESIYGTSASPFKKLEWGRCTQKSIEGGTRLYLHVFDWPADGTLDLPGIMNQAHNAYCLADPTKSLTTQREKHSLIIEVPATATDPINTVIVVDIAGTPDIVESPVISADANQFVDQLEVSITSENEKNKIHYTLDGTAPTATSPLVNGPIQISQSSSIKACCFREGEQASAIAEATFEKVIPAAAQQATLKEPGVSFQYFIGNWDDMPPFAALKPIKTGRLANFTIAEADTADHFAYDFSGFINIPQDGVYTFSTSSDDGSQLFINDKLVVNNAGIHGIEEKQGTVALAAGAHKVRVTYFERDGGNGLVINFSGPGIKKQAIADDMLFIK